MLPFVINGNCPICTNREMRVIKENLEELQKKYPDDWKRLMLVYQNFLIETVQGNDEVGPKNVGHSNF